MDFAAALEELERNQWQALKSADTATEFYRENLTDDSLMSVPYGIADRDLVLSAVAGSPPIVNYEMRNTRVIKLTEDSGIIVYEMTQDRAGVEPFDAAICTVFVRRDGNWRIAYHQQTPLVSG